MDLPSGHRFSVNDFAWACHIDFVGTVRQDGDKSVISAEADVSFLFPLLRRSHQLTDGFKDNLKLLIVLPKVFFESFQLSGKILVRGQNLSKPHERTHDSDVDLDGPVAS